MAIPASAALFGLLLRNAYSQEEAGPKPAFVDGLVAVGLAFVSQLVLASFAPKLVLPHWAPTQGGVWGLEVLIVVRHLLPPSSRLPKEVWQSASSRHTIWKLEEFDQKFCQVKKGHLIAAALLMPASLILVSSRVSLKMRMGAGLILTGTLLLVLRIRWLPRSTPLVNEEALKHTDHSYLEALTCQLSLLRWIEGWYLASLIPGLILILFGSRVYSYLVLLPVLLALALVDLEAVTRKQESGIFVQPHMTKSPMTC